MKAKFLRYKKTLTIFRYLNILCGNSFRLRFVLCAISDPGILPSTAPIRSKAMGGKMQILGIIGGIVVVIFGVCAVATVRDLYLDWRSGWKQFKRQE